MILYSNAFIQLGKPSFRAPEINLALQHGHPLDLSQRDAFSTGCCMHLMLEPDSEFSGFMYNNQYDYRRIAQHTPATPGYPSKLVGLTAGLLEPWAGAQCTQRFDITTVLKAAKVLYDQLPPTGVRRYSCAANNSAVVRAHVQHSIRFNTARVQTAHLAAAAALTLCAALRDVPAAGGTAAATTAGSNAACAAAGCGR